MSIAKGIYENIEFVAIESKRRRRSLDDVTAADVQPYDQMLCQRAGTGLDSASYVDECSISTMSSSTLKEDAAAAVPSTHRGERCVAITVSKSEGNGGARDAPVLGWPRCGALRDSWILRRATELPQWERQGSESRRSLYSLLSQHASVLAILATLIVNAIALATLAYLLDTPRRGYSIRYYRDEMPPPPPPSPSSTDFLGEHIDGAASSSNHAARVLAYGALLNLVLLSLTLGRTMSERRSVFDAIHRCASVCATICALAHASTHLFKLYSEVRENSYVGMLAQLGRNGHAWYFASGGASLLALLLVLALSCCCWRRNYACFRGVHVWAALVFLLAVCSHTYYACLVLIHPLILVWLPSLCRRCLVPVVVRTHMLAESFAVVDLVVPRTRVARYLLLSFLSRHNGNVELSCLVPGGGCFLLPRPRHRCTMLEVRDRHHASYVRLLLSRNEAWSRPLYTRIAKNYGLGLYSEGVSLAVCSASTSHRRCERLERSQHVLFLLEQADIAEFLAYAVMLGDCGNRRMHDRVRHLHLHYWTDEPRYLELIEEYARPCLGMRSIRLRVTLYSDRALVFDERPGLRGTQVDYKSAIGEFLGSVHLPLSASVRVASETLRRKVLRYVRTESDLYKHPIYDEAMFV